MSLLLDLYYGIMRRFCLRPEDLRALEAYLIEAGNEIERVHINERRSFHHRAKHEDLSQEL